MSVRLALEPKIIEVEEGQVVIDEMEGGAPIERHQDQIE